MSNDTESRSTGAIDHEWSDSERSSREVLETAVEGLDREVAPGSVAIDLVTRQPLYIHEQVADSLVGYYEREGFDLFSYKTHPYPPVRLDDRVFKCAFIAHDPQKAHNPGKTYDYPEGRLMKVPLAEAWETE